MPATVLPNERVTFGIRYEDDRLIVVDKPARVVTQPGVGHEHDTLLNGLFARYGDRLQQLGESRGWGLLHRLDRDTSGLVAIALDHRIYDQLRAAFAERRVRKQYWAVCHKAPSQPSGVVRRAIAEQVKRRDKYTSEKFAAVSASGKPALTAYRTIESSESAALVEARPITGRLHQVRVHLASVGAGILGDKRYGNTRAAAAWSRVALHAWRLVLPIEGEEPIDVRSPIARDLRKLLRLHDLQIPSAKPDATDASAEQDTDAVSGDAVGDEDAGFAEDPASVE